MYSTPDDLKLLLAEKELIQLAGDSRGRSWDSEGVQAAMAEAIDQADGEIDGYIGVAVDLPLPKVPRIISNLSGKIAVYNLLRRRPSVPDHWQSEYKRCLDLLKSIAKGTLSLGIPKDEIPAPSPSGSVVVHTASPKFTDETWEKY